VHLVSQVPGEGGNLSRAASAFARELSLLEGFLPFSREMDSKRDSELSEYAVSHRVLFVIARIAVIFVESRAFSADAIEILYRTAHALIIARPFDLRGASGDISGRSVLRPSTRISPNISLHTFGMNLLSLNVAALESILRALKTTNDEFCITLAILPLRWLVAAYAGSCGAFVRNTDDLASHLDSFYWSNNVRLRAIPTFAAVQLLFGLANDKNRFLRNVWQTAAAEPPLTRAFEFFFLQFVGCLIFDSCALARDWDRVQRYQALTALVARPMTVRELCDHLGIVPGEFSHFAQNLLGFATRVPSPAQMRFKVGNVNNWHPFLPFVGQAAIREALATVTETHPMLVFTHDDLRGPSPLNLPLREGLQCPFLYAVVFQCLFNWVHKRELVEPGALVMAVSIVVAMAAEAERSREIPKEVTADSVEKLAALLPANFFEFLRAPVRFKGRQESLFELLRRSGAAGMTALDRMDVSYDRPPLEDDTRKRLAREAKERVLSNFRAQCEAVRIDADSSSEAECSVCRSAGEVVGFPVYVFISFLPYFVLKGNQWLAAGGMRLCNHPIHFSCCGTFSEFCCPVDRCRRTCFLPRIDGDELRPGEDVALDEFLRRGFESSFESAFLSFAAEICLLEIRHRSRPEVVDRPTTSIFFKYGFRALAFLVKVRAQVVPAIKDPTITLLARLTGSADPAEAIEGFIRQIAQNCGEELRRYEFLRRGALIEHFALGRLFSAEPRLDWDSILSYSSLMDRYNLGQGSQLKLPEFDLLRLPVSYLGLSMPPYSFAILDTNSDLAVCLLSGKVVCLARTGNAPWIGDYLATFCHKGASLFLGLTGQRATSVFVASSVQNCAVPVRGIYLDACGDEDPGLQMGRIVNLSTDRLSQVQELFVSGAWTDRLADSVPLDRFVQPKLSAVP
jgi:hypothetical protein